MAKAGVIINLSAGRNNGKGAALAKALAERHIDNVKILNQFADLHPALAALGKANVDILFISSGDGTIQAIVTALAETKLFAKMPRLCILQHGTTNLTAIDVGFTRRSITAQADFIAAPKATTVIKRHTLKVLNPNNETPRHGFSFGAGASARATRLTQTDFNDKGRKGQLAALRMLLGAIFASVFSSPDPQDKSRLNRPTLIQAAVDGKPLCGDEQLMFLATTLEKQFFNARPFWGGKHGPIRVSAFAYPVFNLLRWMLPIMYGSENRTMPKGAVSLSGDSFTITCAEPYVMDGEFFDGPATGPLHVEAGPVFEFITN
ncbi:MAG: diacylglycerol kinase family protein [Aestuariivirga sp.]